MDSRGQTDPKARSYHLNCTLTPEGSLLPRPWEDRLNALAAAREEAGLARRIREPRGIDLCSNDYLGLRLESSVAEAAAEAARRFGAGTGAARLLRGTTPLHEELEADLAAWKGTEACLLFATGFQLNATVIPALAGAGDIIFSDALNHASLVDGCRMAKSAGAEVQIYRHLDLNDLAARLEAWRATARASALALIVTDAVFSMDGDAADLPALVALCERYGALLMADEAHATGLLGPTGAGLAELQGVKGRVPLLMGTLGKSLGSFGAFLCTTEAMRNHLVNTARGFIFSTALPPAAVGAGLEAARLARTKRHRATRALAFASRLRQELGLVEAPSAIVPWVLGEPERALQAARELQSRGFDARAVRPPTVPAGSARIRFTTGAHLHEVELNALLEALHDPLRELGLEKRAALSGETP